MTASSPAAAAHSAVHKLFSFRRVSAIAGNTFRDLVRQKVFYFMVVFALILIGASLILLPLNFRGQLQAVMDVSLGSMGVFTMLLSVLSTAMLIPRDVEERTLYTILAKPVARFEYLVGKLLGVTVMLAVATVLMTVVFCAVLYYWQGKEITYWQNELESADKIAQQVALIKAQTFSSTLFAGIGIVLLRAVVCAALTLMFSAFATSWLFTVVVSFMAILIGHLVPIARSVWLDPTMSGTTPWYLSIFLRLVSVFFPDMQLFNVVDDIAVGAIVPASVFVSALGLGLGYLAVYVLVCWLFFAWKEL